MYFHVKPGKNRIPDIDRDPNRKRAERMARANVQNLKFVSEGHRRDYEKDIKSNPRNIYGAPQFFPPVEIKEFYSKDNVPELSEAEYAEARFHKILIAEIPMPCPDCTPHSHSLRPDENGLTPHEIGPDYCKCKLCGKSKPFGTTSIDPGLNESHKLGPRSNVTLPQGEQQC